MKSLMAVVVGLFCVFTLLFLLAASFGWMNERVVAGWIETARGWHGGAATVAVLVVTLLATDLILPVPSSVVMTLSGSFLGWAGGAAASFGGAMASALLGFAICRRFGGTVFRRFVSEADAARVDAFLRRYGAWGILLSRGVPMLTEVTSCVAGLSRMPLAAFAALSAGGTLPLCIVYAWGGSRGVRTGSGWSILLAFILPALGFALVRLAGRVAERKATFPRRQERQGLACFDFAQDRQNSDTGAPKGKS
jgi:uncharacterized membrane protein YdjX (TVP38/TMEM64 family)